ncbi:hypothetical protein POM88_044564 [Heracleum sosnowskyi]|uniref:Uncharacterized protein n=1 Tax=Heracleum sosnowskyi TaxID=360622 RepID=A0AAD8M314_9APIA|nr:hypothetical protein POM88_044564 [Heracleum sosnowskyi]
MDIGYGTRLVGCSFPGGGGGCCRSTAADRGRSRRHGGVASARFGIAKHGYPELRIRVRALQAATLDLDENGGNAASDENLGSSAGETANSAGIGGACMTGFVNKKRPITYGLVPPMQIICTVYIPRERAHHRLSGAQESCRKRGGGGAALSENIGNGVSDENIGDSDDMGAKSTDRVFLSSSDATKTYLNIEYPPLDDLGANMLLITGKTLETLPQLVAKRFVSPEENNLEDLTIEGIL